MMGVYARSIIIISLPNIPSTNDNVVIAMKSSPTITLQRQRHHIHPGAVVVSI